jgi:hypothetical protein
MVTLQQRVPEIWGPRLRFRLYRYSSRQKRPGSRSIAGRIGRMPMDPAYLQFILWRLCGCAKVLLGTDGLLLKAAVNLLPIAVARMRECGRWRKADPRECFYHVPVPDRMDPAGSRLSLSGKRTFSLCTPDSAPMFWRSLNIMTACLGRLHAVMRVNVEHPGI